MGQNNCALAALSAVVLTSIFMMPSGPSGVQDRRLLDDNQSLKADNKALQDRLFAVSTESKKAYEAAVESLNQEKKRVARMCGK